MKSLGTGTLPPVSIFFKVLRKRRRNWTNCSAGMKIENWNSRCNLIHDNSFASVIYKQLIDQWTLHSQSLVLNISDVFFFKQ